MAKYVYETTSDEDAGLAQLCETTGNDVAEQFRREVEYALRQYVEKVVSGKADIILGKYRIASAPERAAIEAAAGVTADLVSVVSVARDG